MKYYNDNITNTYSMTNGYLLMLEHVVDLDVHTYYNQRRTYLHLHTT